MLINACPSSFGTAFLIAIAAILLVLSEANTIGRLILGEDNLKTYRWLFRGPVQVLFIAIAVYLSELRKRFSAFVNRHYACLRRKIDKATSPIPSAAQNHPNTSPILS
jgi:hypothetical protein